MPCDSSRIPSPNDAPMTKFRAVYAGGRKACVGAGIEGCVGSFAERRSPAAPAGEASPPQRLRREQQGFAQGIRRRKRDPNRANRRAATTLLAIAKGTGRPTSSRASNRRLKERGGSGGRSPRTCRYGHGSRGASSDMPNWASTRLRLWKRACDAGELGVAVRNCSRTNSSATAPNVNQRAKLHKTGGSSRHLRQQSERTPLLATGERSS
jgi:hypothetical protein